MRSRWRRPPYGLCQTASWKLFVGIHAPHFLLLDIALEPVSIDKAPGSVAIADVDDHPRLKRRGQIRRGGRAGVELRVLALFVGRDQRRSPPGKQRMKHPALDAFRIADLAPDFKLCGNFHWEPGPLVDPFCRVLLGWALSQVDPVGFQTSESRHRQFGDWPDGIGERRVGRQDQGAGQREHAAAGQCERIKCSLVSVHAAFPDSDPAIIVFARSSAKEANPADRSSWARRRIHLRRLSLTRRELSKGAEAMMAARAASAPRERYERRA